MKIAAFLMLAAVCAAAPRFESTRLFEGATGGYKLYRIPGIVVTRKGTILAYTEARRNGSGDWDTINIVMRRSTDGGKTFSPQRVIAHAPGRIERSPVALERKQSRPDDVTYNNPAAIADRNGAVHFLFCVEYMRAFYMRSDDDGQTFSAPVEITSAFDAFRLISSQVPDIRFSASELDALLVAVAKAEPAFPHAESLSSAALKLQGLAQSV